MSDDPSTRDRRITRPCFRICSTYMSCSQAPLYPYARHTIANRVEGAFGLLRYFFGGDRPSQTAHIARSLAQIHGTRLEPQRCKSGISPTAPPRLAPQLQSVPPILHNNYPMSMRSYSKGSRGLSVPLRVTGIFTDTSISPNLSLRQSPYRYTIRAGRNLPDKDFRYLRTVIVTAAVYWGFNSKLLLADDFSF